MDVEQVPVRRQEGDNMTAQNHRQTPRFDSLNLLVYAATDEEGECVATGMGRTLNVSRLGILLETKDHLASGQAVSVAIGFAENLVNVIGLVMHCEPAGDGLFHMGIEFSAMSRQTAQILEQYLQHWQGQQG